jgi:hypothetical protein
MAQTYYEILGVAENATSEEIEAAFKRRAREVHPDTVAPGNAYLRQVAAEAFKDLSEAKAVLLDPAEREKYDAKLTYRRGSKRTYAAPAGPPSASQTTPRSQSIPPAARGPRPRPMPKRTPRLRPWNPSPANLGSLLFVVLGLGLVFFLVGMMWSGRNPPLWLAVITVSLGLLSFRHGMKPSANIRIPGGRMPLVVSTIVFAAILLSVWLLSEPNIAPQTATDRFAPMLEDAQKAKTPGNSPSGATERKPTVVAVDPGGEGDTPGFVTKFWKNLTDGKNYRTRLSGDLLYLEPVRAPGKGAGEAIECEFHRAVSGGLSWAGICSERDPTDQSTRKSPAILSTFSDTRMQGSPSDMPGFDMIPVENVAMGSAAPSGVAAPSEETHRAERELSTLSGPEKDVVESLCLSAKIAVGQDEYNRCVEKQAAEMKSVPSPPDLSGLSSRERDAVESACSSAKLMQGPVAYNQCVAKQLELLKKQRR